MEKYEEMIETIRQNLQGPETKSGGNYLLLKSAIDEYSGKSANIIKEFVKEDKFLVLIWKYKDQFYVSNLNQFFIEFDKYKFNDKNAAIFLFKDLTAFSEELFEIE